MTIWNVNRQKYRMEPDEKRSRKELETLLLAIPQDDQARIMSLLWPSDADNLIEAYPDLEFVRDVSDNMRRNQGYLVCFDETLGDNVPVPDMPDTIADFDDTHVLTVSGLLCEIATGRVVDRNVALFSRHCRYYMDGTLLVRGRNLAGGRSVRKVVSGQQSLAILYLDGTLMVGTAEDGGGVRWADQTFRYIQDVDISVDDDRVWILRMSAIEIVRRSVLPGHFTAELEERLVETHPAIPPYDELINRFNLNVPEAWAITRNVPGHTYTVYDAIHQHISIAAALAILRNFTKINVLSRGRAILRHDVTAVGRLPNETGILETSEEDGHTTPYDYRLSADEQYAYLVYNDSVVRLPFAQLYQDDKYGIYIVRDVKVFKMKRYGTRFYILVQSL